ncbi:hypothetical protein LUX29_20480 [Aureimonas altamirensis]|uniref:hypothetical protein n=1 Tax=Aureimonas altamirensis TaxID=370622 RepID=UPI001E421425|nr:hypothetical protein [Aureimonas altamirensis]UHD45339.1 hypothetical protein LUX29_20480 [Aureimonas altamirensis]
MDNRPAAAVEKALESAAASPNISMDHIDLPAVRARVLNELEPTLINITNNEAWYQSRVTWGVIVAAVATMIKPFAGEFFDAQTAIEYAEALASGGQLFGFGLTIYGRWAAKKPLPL